MYVTYICVFNNISNDIHLYNIFFLSWLMNVRYKMYRQRLAGRGWVIPYIKWIQLIYRKETILFCVLFLNILHALCKNYREVFDVILNLSLRICLMVELFFFWCSKNDFESLVEFLCRYLSWLFSKTQFKLLFVISTLVKRNLNSRILPDKSHIFHISRSCSNYDCVKVLHVNTWILHRPNVENYLTLLWLCEFRVIKYRQINT